MLMLTPVIGPALLWLVGVGRRAVHGIGWGPILDVTSHIRHCSVCRLLPRWQFRSQLLDEWSWSQVLGGRILFRVLLCLLKKKRQRNVGPGCDRIAN